MSADYFLAFFLLFAASGLFLWLLGAAAFYRSLGTESIFRAPWLGYALLVGLCRSGTCSFRSITAFPEVSWLQPACWPLSHFCSAVFALDGLGEAA
jgi:hypothetical protein